MGESRFVFDPNTLTDPVPLPALRGFVRSQSFDSPNRSVIAATMTVCVTLTIILSVGIATAWDKIGAAQPWVVAFIVAANAVVLIVCGIRCLLRRPSRRTLFRVARFAHATGYGFWATARRHAHDGVLFHTGEPGILSSIVTIPGPRAIEVGNYCFELPPIVGGVFPSRLHHYGYSRLRISVPLPNIFLQRVDGSTRRVSRELAPAGHQRLSLEGDFDRFYTLYCPADYEPDALYLFTPDVCALLIDAGWAFDVEVVGTSVYLYTRKHLSTTEPEQWQQLFATIDALTQKLNQWERWRESHKDPDPAIPAREAAPDRQFSSSPSVAQAGARLRPRSRILLYSVTIVCAVAAIILRLLDFN